MTVSSAHVGVALVEGLLSAGVTDIVTCPGSRSAPLLLTLADAEQRSLVRLHVRVDERSAGYLALGIAKGSGRPVAVVTTSGTAAVNLHPAIVEAAYGGTPLIAITADRPARLRGSGANQAIDQRALFGVDAKAHDIEAEGATADRVRELIMDAVAAGMPLHLNVPLAEPLVEVGSHSVSTDHGRAFVKPLTRNDRQALAHLVPDDVDVRRGVLLVGDGTDGGAGADAVNLAAALGWPIISEPTGNLGAADRLRHGPLVLADTDFMAAHPPQVVVSIGRIGLHRSVMQLLRACPVHIAVDVPPRRGRVDPALSAQHVVAAVPTASSVTPDDAWIAAWRDADAAVASVVARGLEAAPLSGPVVAREVVRAVGADDLLVIGPSWPIRHVAEFAGPIGGRCLANRGTSGIDGVVSTAWGAATTVEDGTTYALLGDLTAIYDRNGFLAPEGEPRPRLVYVVVDNNGGGIFSSLEQGAPEFAQTFERVFGTPHGADLSRLLSAPGVEIVDVDSVPQLRAALVHSDGVRVVVAKCVDRSEELQIARAGSGLSA